MGKSDRGEIFIGLLLGVFLVCAALTGGIVTLLSFDSLPETARSWSWQYFAISAAVFYAVGFAFVIRTWTANRDRAFGMLLGLASPFVVAGIGYLVLGAMASSR